MFYLHLYNGKFWYCNNNTTKYVSNYNEIKGKSVKVGILLDMYTKSLKFFINDIDMAFALENYDKLGEGELFASLAN